MVSDTAVACPHCGARVHGNHSTSAPSTQQGRLQLQRGFGSYALIALIVLLGLAGGFALYKIVVKPSPGSVEKPKEEMVQPKTRIDVVQDVPESLKDENADEEKESRNEDSEPAKEDIYGSYSLAGQVDKYPVEMDFDISGTHVEGSYVYIGKSPTDLKLYGTIEGNRMKLKEINEKGEMSGIFDGTFESDVYSGTFYRYRNGSNDMVFDFRLKRK